MIKKLHLTLLFFVFCNGLARAQHKLKAIKAGTLIDVVNGTVLKNQIILIDADTILVVGSSLTICTGP
jgi:hypothetical protein